MACSHRRTVSVVSFKAIRPEAKPPSLAPKEQFYDVKRCLSCKRIAMDTWNDFVYQRGRFCLEPA